MPNYPTPRIRQSTFTDPAPSIIHKTMMSVPPVYDADLLHWSATYELSDTLTADLPAFDLIDVSSPSIPPTTTEGRPVRVFDPSDGSEVWSYPDPKVDGRYWSVMVDQQDPAVIVNVRVPIKVLGLSVSDAKAYVRGIGRTMRTETRRRAMLKEAEKWFTYGLDKLLEIDEDVARVTDPAEQVPPARQIEVLVGHMQTLYILRMSAPGRAWQDDLDLSLKSIMMKVEKAAHQVAKPVV